MGEKHTKQLVESSSESWSNKLVKALERSWSSLFVAVDFMGLDEAPDFHLLSRFRGSGVLIVSGCLKVTPMTAQANEEVMSNV